MGKDYAESFWKHLDKLLSQSKIVIDRPKGSVHPRYPQIVYELDYGYLDGTKSSDNEGIDVWLGTDAEHKLDAIVCTVDLVKRGIEPGTRGFLVGCTLQAVMLFCYCLFLLWFNPWFNSACVNQPKNNKKAATFYRNCLILMW